MDGAVGLMTTGHVFNVKGNVKGNLNEGLTNKWEMNADCPQKCFKKYPGHWKHYMIVWPPIAFRSWTRSQ